MVLAESGVVYICASKLIFNYTIEGKNCKLARWSAIEQT